MGEGWHSPLRLPLLPVLRKERETRSRLLCFVALSLGHQEDPSLNRLSLEMIQLGHLFRNDLSQMELPRRAANIRVK